jgi:hypothetical protein
MKNSFLLFLLVFPSFLFAQYDDYYYDEEDTPVITSEYQTVQNSNGMTGLEKIVDKKLVIPYNYNSIYIDDVPEGNDENFFRVENANGKQGVFSLKDKKEIIPCKYSGTELFYYDYFPNDEKPGLLYCIIGTNSDQIDTPKDYYALNGTLILTTDEDIEWGINLSTNNITGILYQKDNYSLKDGYFIYNRLTGKIIQNRKCNIIDRTMSDELLIVDVNGKQGVMNTLTGNYLFNPIYGSITTDPEFVLTKGEEVSYVDAGGKVIFPTGMYSKIGPNSCDNNPAGYKCAISVQKGGKWGCVDNQNKIVIPIIYDSSIYYTDTMWVSKNGKWGAINIQNQTIIDFQYDNLNFSSYENYDWEVTNYYQVKKDNKWGCIKTDGQNLIPIEYDQPVYFADTMWAIKNNKWGCITNTLNTVIEFKLDVNVYSQFEFTNDGISCLKNNQPYKLDAKGNEIIRKGLVEAVQTSDRDAVLLSVKNANSTDKSIALYYAIYNFNLEIFSLLMQNNPELQSSYDHKPPIYHVALKANSAYGDQKSICFEMLKMLVQAGADINQKGWFGETPLMCYFSGNYNPDIDFVKALLDAGANVNLKDDHNKDVFDLLDNASKDIKTLLKSYKN